MVAVLVLLGAGILAVVGVYVLVRSAFHQATSPLACATHPVAPDGPPEARAAWATKGMGTAYTGMAAWVERSRFAEGRIGKVTSVAPIGSPNCTKDFFTDGRFADLNLEVRGERGAATFTILGSQVWSNGEVHFHSAKWVEPNAAPIDVNETDRTQAEFESPAYQMEHWSKIIAEREGKGELAYVTAYEKRAAARFALGDARGAAEDAQRAIDRYSKDAESTTTNPGPNEQHGWTEDLRARLRPHRLRRAIYLDGAQAFAESAAEYARAFDLPEDRHAHLHAIALTPEHLGEWVVRRHAGHGDAADAALRGRIAHAKELGETCWVPLAEHLLAPPSDDAAFLANVKVSFREGCDGPQEKNVSRARYYLARRRMLAGDKARACALLHEVAVTETLEEGPITLFLRRPPAGICPP